MTGDKNLEVKVFKTMIMMCLALIISVKQGYCMGSKPPGPPPDLEIGKRLYGEHCADCHGENAEGQDPQRKAGGNDQNGVPIAPALNGTAHTWHHSPKLLYRYLDKGSILKNSPMPSFGDELNRHEILSIIAYLQSLWPEKIREHYFKRFK